jgi:hypothetical protein
MDIIDLTGQYDDMMDKTDEVKNLLAGNSLTVVGAILGQLIADYIVQHPPKSRKDELLKLNQLVMQLVPILIAQRVIQGKDIPNELHDTLN